MKVFEEKAREIFRYICPYKARGIIDPTTGKSDPKSAVRLRYADFAKAQDLIINELKSIMVLRRDLNAQMKMAKTSRNKPLVVRLERELKKEAFKETIIRKLADSIAWQLVGGRSDLIHWLHGDEKPPAIDESNLESVLEEVNIINQSNPLSFALISDLTSFVQVGDILKRDTSAFIKIIEVKEGKANQKVAAIIEDELLVEKDGLNFARLEGVHGTHLAQQVRRTYRQWTKGARVEEIINTGRGKDPNSGNSVVVWDPSRKVAYYEHKLAELLLELDNKPWAYTIIDTSLKVGCYKGKMKRAGKSILELLAQTSLRRSFITINFSEGLLVPTSEPIFLKPFREDDIFDIIFDRIRVYMVLDIDWMIKAFRERGGRADWLSRKETTKLLQQEKYDRPFVFEGRSISIENEKWSMFVGGGALRRIFFDNFLPSSVVSMLLESMEFHD